MYVYNDETITCNSRQTCFFSCLCQLLPTFIPVYFSPPGHQFSIIFMAPLQSPTTFFSVQHHLCGCGGFERGVVLEQSLLSAVLENDCRYGNNVKTSVLCVFQSQTAKCPPRNFISHSCYYQQNTEHALSLKQPSSPGENLRRLPTKHILLCFHLYRIKNTNPHANSGCCLSIE